MPAHIRDIVVFYIRHLFPFYNRIKDSVHHLDLHEQDVAVVVEINNPACRKHKDFSGFLCIQSAT